MKREIRVNDKQNQVEFIEDGLVVADVFWREGCAPSFYVYDTPQYAVLTEPEPQIKAGDWVRVVENLFVTGLTNIKGYVFKVVEVTDESIRLISPASGKIDGAKPTNFERFDKPRVGDVLPGEYVPEVTIIVSPLGEDSILLCDPFWVAPISLKPNSRWTVQWVKP